MCVAIMTRFLFSVLDIFSTINMPLDYLFLTSLALTLC